MLKSIQLGRHSGLQVSRLCLGTMNFGEPGRGHQGDWTLGIDDARPLFKAAIDKGLYYFDCADIYGVGASETVVGALLRELLPRDQYVLTTKLFSPMGRNPNQGGLSRKHVMEGIDASLKRLGVDYVDQLIIHRHPQGAAGREGAPVEEAMEALKKFPAPKFDQSVTISMHMGVDPKKGDQMIRSTCPLPHGTGKKVTVLVFAKGNAAEAAKAAGAEFVGYEDLIKKVTEGFLDFDVAIATTEAMSEVRKLGRQLGPRGLMPNPKTGTVTDDTAAAVKAVKAGRVDFKLDKNGNISVPVGKASFTTQQLAENAEAVIEAVYRAKPATARGKYIETIHVTATMTPSVKIDAAKYARN